MCCGENARLMDPRDQQNTPHDFGRPPRYKQLFKKRYCYYEYFKCDFAKNLKSCTFLF